MPARWSAERASSWRHAPAILGCAMRMKRWLRPSRSSARRIVPLPRRAVSAAWISAIHSSSAASAFSERSALRQRCLAWASEVEASSWKSRGYISSTETRVSVSSSLGCTVPSVPGSRILSNTRRWMLVALILPSASLGSAPLTHCFRSDQIRSKSTFLPRVTSAMASVARLKGSAFRHIDHAALAKSSGQPEALTWTLLLQEIASRCSMPAESRPMQIRSSICQPAALAWESSPMPGHPIPSIAWSSSILLSRSAATRSSKAKPAPLVERVVATFLRFFLGLAFGMSAIYPIFARHEH